MLNYIWIAVFVLMLIIEGAAPGLVCIWFAAGALIAFILNLCGVPLSVQLIAFVLASAAFVALLRPWAAKHINSRRAATNADAFIGAEGVVTEEIDEVKGTGKVRIRGQIWTARSVSGAVIPEGTSVRSRSIEGVKMMVEPIE